MFFSEMKKVFIIMQLIKTKFNLNILKITINTFLLKHDNIYSFLIIKVSY